MILESKRKKIAFALFLLVLTLTIPFLTLSNGSFQTKTPEMAQGQTAIALPDGDIQTPWSTATPHYTKLDECESVLDPVDGSYVAAYDIEGDNEEIEIFSIDDSIQSIILVSQVKIYTNGYSIGGTNPLVSIWWDGEWTAWQTVNLPLNPGPYPPPEAEWRENSFSVVGSRNDLCDLEVRYKARCTGWIDTGPPFYISIPIGTNVLNAFFCEVTYEDDPAPQIITPEPINYDKPMDGYYPATYGFESDMVNSNPEGWIVNEVGGSVTVSNEFNEHKKVVDLYKTSQGSGISCYLEQSFSKQTDGTIEFWWAVDTFNYPAYVRQYFSVYDTTLSGLIFELRIYQDRWFSYRDDTGRHNLFQWEANKWYHVSVKFDCKISKYYLAIHDSDGNYIGGDGGSGYSFMEICASIDKVAFTSGNYVCYWHHYIDAIGYTWEDNYNIRDNFFKGLLLGFEPDDYNSMSYSLNGIEGPFIPILGDTVIPFPNTGSYDLVIKGDQKTSDIVTFSIDNPIDISSPVDTTTYTNPVEGYYLGTYGFENDDHYAYGTDVSILDEWMGNMGAFLRMHTVDGPVDGHNKLFTIVDSQASSLTTGVHNFDNPQSSGTIEFWLRMDDGTELGSDDRFHEIHFRKSDDTIAFRAQLKMLEGGWASGDRADVAYHHGSSWEEFADCEDETWYHHTIIFDCAGDGRFTWIITAEDGTLMGMISDISFENSMTTLDEIFFTSTHSHYRGNTYWDAIGFDWDPDYTIGDNKHEGILLSYESGIPLEWAGVIIDDKPIQTLLGDKVLPLFDVGDHTIRLVGKDSSGITYYSDVVHYRCEPEGWHINPIGSVDRKFFQDSNTKLGFTFYTFPSLHPKVKFKVSEDGDDTEVTINLYLENDPDSNPDPFWSKTLDIDESNEFEQIYVNSFKQYMVNTLVIEIENSGDSEYTLDYLEIHDCFFQDYIYDDVGDNYYSPNTFKEQGEIMDYLIVSTNTLLTNLRNPEGIIDHGISQCPRFATSLIAAIDDDYEENSEFITRDYYINSVKYKIRMIDPEGSYIPNSRLWVEENEMQTSAEVDPEPAYKNNDVLFLIQNLIHIVVDYIEETWPGNFIDWNYLLNWIFYLGGEDTLTDSIFDYFWEDNGLIIKWEDGIFNYHDANPLGGDYDGGCEPRNRLKEISLWSHWECDPRDTYGDHQVEVSWEIEVKEYVREKRLCIIYILGIPIIIPYFCHFINTGFSVTGTQYFNFNFI